MDVIENIIKYREAKKLTQPQLSELIGMSRSTISNYENRISRPNIDVLSLIADAEMIDPGDWFPGTTAAIPHYGDSMREYPSGSILALKEIKDLANGFVLGQNYVVEYGDDWNRVTKRIQKKGNVFMAYSTNSDAYPDGTLIHQPFELHNIHKAWRVLGYVVKTAQNVLNDLLRTEIVTMNAAGFMINH